MLTQTLEEGRKLTDAALERLLPRPNMRPTSIHQAMRHSVFAGGKRIRPILCMEAGRAIAGSLPVGIEDMGAALEMLDKWTEQTRRHAGVMNRALGGLPGITVPEVPSKRTHVYYQYCIYVSDPARAKRRAIRRGVRAGEGRDRSGRPAGPGEAGRHLRGDRARQRLRLRRRRLGEPVLASPLRQ